MKKIQKLGHSKKGLKSKLQQLKGFQSQKSQAATQKKRERKSKIQTNLIQKWQEMKKKRAMIWKNRRMKKKKKKKRTKKKMKKRKRRRIKKKTTQLTCTSSAKVITTIITAKLRLTANSDSWTLFWMKKYSRSWEQGGSSAMQFQLSISTLMEYRVFLCV